jgi:hypothetical protein
MGLMGIYLLIMHNTRRIITQSDTSNKNGVDNTFTYYMHWVWLIGCNMIIFLMVSIWSTSNTVAFWTTIIAGIVTCICICIFEYLKI